MGSDSIAPRAGAATTINFEATGSRACGDCQLCCKLVPVPELGKKASHRCKHQKFGVGCAIYRKRPFSCAMWNCRWLTDPETNELRRPDRSHYVIDAMPDFVTLTDTRPAKKATSRSSRYGSTRSIRTRIATRRCAAISRGSARAASQQSSATTSARRSRSFRRPWPPMASGTSTTTSTPRSRRRGLSRSGSLVSRQQRR